MGVNERSGCIPIIAAVHIPARKARSPVRTLAKRLLGSRKKLPEITEAEAFEDSDRAAVLELLEE
jgi:hypothetical protein